MVSRTFRVIMLLSASSKKRFRSVRILSFSAICLLISLFALAQVNLKYRMLSGYSLSTDAPVNKSKPTLFVFEQAETLEQVFKAVEGNRRPDQANFGKEMIIGVVIPPTSKPPKLSVSKVFVQDSMLTVRYISIKDTTTEREPQPQPTRSQPTLLLAIPKQTVLRTRLVENGKVVQTIKKRESGE